MPPVELVKFLKKLCGFGKPEFIPSPRWGDLSHLGNDERNLSPSKGRRLNEQGSE